MVSSRASVAVVCLGLVLAAAAEPLECSSTCKGTIGRPEVATNGTKPDVVSLLECLPNGGSEEKANTKFCADSCSVVPPSKPALALRCEEKRSEPRALSLAQMKEQTRLREGCPPPQPCSCHCYCPEIVWPVPPPSPLLPTPAPFFGLLQTNQQVSQHQHPVSPVMPAATQQVAAQEKSAHVKAEAVRLLQLAARKRGGRKGKQPGTALPPPGAPINLLPPPPAPPLPPMPKDFRGQPCPENSPCNCYCHCRAPPAE